MSSAMPGASDRKPTRRAGRKAPTLRPDPNTSVTAGEWVVISEMTMLPFILRNSQSALLKGTNRQHSGQMGQNIKNWKNNRNTTSQANWGMW